MSLQSLLQTAKTKAVAAATFMWKYRKIWLSAVVGIAVRLAPLPKAVPEELVEHTYKAITNAVATAIDFSANENHSQYEVLNLCVMTAVLLGTVAGIAFGVPAATITGIAGMISVAMLALAVINMLRDLRTQKSLRTI